MQDSSRMSGNNLWPGGIAFPNEMVGSSCKANAPSHAHKRPEEGRT
jgi:hypothetical protein